VVLLNSAGRTFVEDDGRGEDGDGAEAWPGYSQILAGGGGDCA
jgi:hypothetical protein